MNKTQKENSIFELRLKGIESLDRDATSISIKLLFGWFAILAYFYKVGFNSFTLYILVVIFVFMTLYQTQSERYVRDCYNWLAKSVMENKLLDEQMPLMKPYQAFYYRPLFSKRS